MRNFGKLKVKVTGVGEAKNTNTNSKDPSKETTVSVNMKNNSAKTITSKAQKTYIGFLKAIKESLDRENVTAVDGCHLINLELKRMYIECIGDGHFDTETNQYLDSILFDTMESIILSYVESEDKNPKITESIILQSIDNSVKLLDYTEQFDYECMNMIVHEFVEVFK